MSLHEIICTVYQLYFEKSNKRSYRRYLFQSLVHAQASHFIQVDNVITQNCFLELLYLRNDTKMKQGCVYKCVITGSATRAWCLDGARANK